MPTSVFVNQQLGLRAQFHSGDVGLHEFATLISHYRANRAIFLYDVIHILEETTAFTFGTEALPQLKRDFGALIQRSDMPLILRSAWVCPSARAWNVLEAWLHERHSLDGLNTEPCLVGTLDEAAGLFDHDELHAVRYMAGFDPHFSI